MPCLMLAPSNGDLIEQGNRKPLWSNRASIASDAVFLFQKMGEWGNNGKKILLAEAEE